MKSKHIFKFFTVWILLILIFFMETAFVKNEINPFKWDEGVRFFLASIVIILALPLAAMVSDS